MPKLPPIVNDKLTTKDVTSGDILQIKGKGRNVEFKIKNKDGRDTGEVEIKCELELVLPDGRIKKKVINTKSRKHLEKAWGDNTDDWDGNVVMVAIEDSAQFGEFIVLYPTKSPARNKPIDRGDGITETEVPF